jgi:hypothetical protein
VRSSRCNAGSTTLWRRNGSKIEKALAGKQGNRLILRLGRGNELTKAVERISDKARGCFSFWMMRVMMRMMTCWRLRLRACWKAVSGTCN